MSYQVIARKWRPQGFDEVTGQDHITRTLRNAIEHDRLHHAYLFSGARGVGKTTTARLFAKALNCHKTEKPNPQPCKMGDANICPSCLEITESRSIDVLEFDAASNTGVQDIRDIILDGVNIGTARDRFKIFIIDEVHMLSTSSFNALLKTVEEPPPRVAFIMATTELHKVPDTIRSRSQEFVFRTIPQGQIFERLRLIADAEKIVVADDALQVIARSGEGSMRDAQSNFDQVISFSGEKITVNDVSAALGLAGAEVLARIVTAIATGDTRTAMEVVAGLIDNGQDLRNFCRDVLGVIRDLLMFRVSGGDATLVGSSALPPEQLMAQAERLSEADLVRAFHSLAETETRLKEAVQSRYVLEVGLIKLIEMRRVKPVEELLNRLASLEASIGSQSPDEAGTPNQSAAAAASEKKTLNADRNADIPVPNPQNADIPAVDRNAEIPVRNPVASETVSPSDFDPIPTFSQIDLAEPEFGDLEGPVVAIEQTPPRFALDDPSFINSLPVKLPPISSEDLEHIEDKALDRQYELKLEWTGDDLLPISRAAHLAASLVAGSSAAAPPVAGSNGSAAAPARIPLNLRIPQLDAEVDENSEVPTLPENPTEEQLFAYAEAHPLVQKAKRVFRAKVLRVTPK